MEVLRRVEDQGRIEDGEAERRENLNEKQRSRSLRSLGEAAFEKVHPALLCCSRRRIMSSRACYFSGVDAAGLCCSGRRAACASSCSGTRVACGISELQPTRPPLHENAYNVTLDAAF